MEVHQENKTRCRINQGSATWLLIQSMHKTVFAFRLAYIIEIERAIGVKLPIILDSPSGKEVALYVKYTAGKVKFASPGGKRRIEETGLIDLLNMPDVLRVFHDSAVRRKDAGLCDVHDFQTAQLRGIGNTGIHGQEPRRPRACRVHPSGE